MGVACAIIAEIGRKIEEHMWASGCGIISSLCVTSHATLVVKSVTSG